MTKSGAKVCCIFFAILTVVMIFVTVLLYPHKENNGEKQVKAVEAYVLSIESFRKKDLGAKTSVGVHTYNRIKLNYEGESYDIEIQAESKFATDCRNAYDMHTTVTAYWCEGELYSSAEAPYNNADTSGRYYVSMGFAFVCLFAMAVFIGVYIDKRKIEP